MAPFKDFLIGKSVPFPRALGFVRVFHKYKGWYSMPISSEIMSLEASTSWCGGRWSAAFPLSIAWTLWIEYIRLLQQTLKQIRSYPKRLKRLNLGKEEPYVFVKGPSDDDQRSKNQESIVKSGSNHRCKNFHTWNQNFLRECGEWGLYHEMSGQMIKEYARWFPKVHW